MKRRDFGLGPGPGFGSGLGSEQVPREASGTYLHMHTFMYVCSQLELAFGVSCRFVWWLTVVLVAHRFFGGSPFFWWLAFFVGGSPLLLWLFFCRLAVVGSV